MRYSVAYGFFALVWIVASDVVLDLIDRNQVQVNIIKGWVFIGLTSVLLWALMRRQEQGVALADQRARHEVRELVDQSTEVFYVVDLQGRLLMINRAFGELVDIEPRSAVGRSRDDLLDGVPAAVHRAADASVRSTGQTVVAVEDIGDAEHRRRFRSSRFPIRDRIGRIVAIGCIAVDITEEERVQDQLRSSEAAYRLMFHSSPFPLWIHDATTLQMLAVNDAALALYRYDRSDFLSLRVPDMSPTMADARAVEDEPSVDETGRPRITTHVDARGHLIDVEIDSTPTIYDEHDAVVVVTRDVTEQRQAIERDRLLLRLPTMYEQSLDGSFLNEVVERLLRLTRSTGARHVECADDTEFTIGEAEPPDAARLTVLAADNPEPIAIITLWGKPFEYTPADELVCKLVMLQAHRLLERERFIKDQQQAADRQELTLKGIARTVGAIVDARDPYTAGHQQRVGELAAAMGHRLGLPDKDVTGLRIGGYVHDVGKIATPFEILTRSGPLDPLERKMIQRHSRAGRDILSPVPFPWPIATMIDQHHERLDGSGYPEGLRGDDIILEARIIAVADVFDAITSNRPYRPGRSVEVAIEELRRGAGVVYDAAAVAALIAHVECAAPAVHPGQLSLHPA